MPFIFLLIGLFLNHPMLDLGHLALLCNKAYYLYSYYVCADSSCVDFLKCPLFLIIFANFVLADKQNNVILKSG